MVICPSCTEGVETSSRGDFEISREDDNRVVMTLDGVLIHRCRDGSYAIGGDADPELERLLAGEERPLDGNGNDGVREPRRPSGSGPSNLGAVIDE
jgi:hypothetical protein